MIVSGHMSQVNSSQKSRGRQEEQAGEVFLYHLTDSYDPKEVIFLSCQEQEDSATRGEVTSKVQCITDERNFCDLSGMFLDVSVEVLTQVWESNNQSWDACFDLLRSWQASHGPVLINMSQLKFDLLSEEWPSLPRLLRPCLSGTSSVSMSVSSLSCGLTKLQLDKSCVYVSDEESVGGLSTSDEWSFCDEVSRDEQDIHSDIGENWVQVHDDAQEKDDQAKKKSKKKILSFKDVLMLPSQEQDQDSLSPDSMKKRSRTDNTAHCGPSQKKPWRPSFVFVRVPHQHQNVVYMNSAVMKNALPWDYTDDEEEGFGLGYGSTQASTTKCFARTALTNSRRVRKAVLQNNNQHVKVLRCKF